MAKPHPRVSQISLGRCLSSSLLRLRLRRAAKKSNKSRLRLSQHRHKKAAAVDFVPSIPLIEAAPDSPRYEVGEYDDLPDSPRYEVCDYYDDTPDSPRYEVGEYNSAPDSPCYEVGEYDSAPDSPCYEVGEYDSDSPCYEVGEYDSAPDSPHYEVGEYSDAPDSPRYEVGDYEEEEAPYAGVVLDSVWRGCLQIRGASFSCLRAHLSKKACAKAVKAATALPREMLCATITPRLESWPKRFDESPSGPTEDNIGIYLLPADDLCREGYDMLVNEVMRRDLAMTVYELLIFGSNQLPPPLWHFCGKYYLWGVFSAREEELTMKKRFIS